MSNQGGISLKSDSKSLKSDLKRLGDFKRKVTAVFTQLDLPISIYAATSRDRFRKPRTGMWEQLLEDFNLTAAHQVDLDTSFFVGDAGGRTGHSSGGVSKDHSCCDRDFATNVGIKFLTPEEYFLEEEPKPFVREFDPAKYINNATSVVFSKQNPLDVILFCGSPGAGKSTFYWNYLKPLGYERINQDILKTRERCLKKAAELIKEETPVVVDNTNPDPDTRAHWVKLARNLDVPIRCIHFTASLRLCEHNDAVRSLNETMNPEKRTMLPRLAFTGFASRYREPKLEEGFQDITKVDFMFQGTAEEETIWRKFWI
ncbi:DNA kinase/phosphatase Pnk1 [Coniosporium apollinis]|uniref:DNA kinase/phosphatase Pnk1 n=1 Tax=Coniosporium apollinis TaxID=61459 RepID=A0ABQ9NI45_9PEZI|nr:DNA kinase/phosphatase Pnk1 [Coniosporium apollinis]